MTNFEEEIAKRDARIAELEYERDSFQRVGILAMTELAALKAQQPSAGVVDERAAFERHFKSVGSLTVNQLAHARDTDGMPFYEHLPTRIAWSAWQARARLNPCRAQAVADEWVDIAKRLPEIGQHCLIKIPVCGRHEIEGATYKGDGVWAAAWCSSRGRDCTYKVSHWMTAPSAKKESGDE